MEQDSAASLSGTDAIRSTASGPGDTTVVELHGDIDFDGLEPLRGCLVHGVERGADVLVDLTDVTLIDCVCLGVLVEAARLADLRGPRGLPGVAVAVGAPYARRDRAGHGLPATVTCPRLAAGAARRMVGTGR